MRLKEIKPGMYIYCKNLDELKALLAEANRLGYRWADGTLATNVCCTENASIKFHSEDTRRPYKYITWGEVKEGTEFSDLILPELTAEEALRISTEICNASDSVRHLPARRRERAGQRRRRRHRGPLEGNVRAQGRGRAHHAGELQDL